jgi:hypothetical protein
MGRVSAIDSVIRVDDPGSGDGAPFPASGYYDAYTSSKKKKVIWINRDALLFAYSNETTILLKDMPTLVVFVWLCLFQSSSQDVVYSSAERDSSSSQNKYYLVMRWEASFKLVTRFYRTQQVNKLCDFKERSQTLLGLITAPLVVLCFACHQMLERKLWIW